MSLAIPRPLSLPTDSIEAEEGRITPAAPPWLWMWVVLFILNIPSMLAGWQSSFNQIAMIRDSTATLREAFPGENYGRLEWLTYPSVLLEFLPSAALLVGLALVFIPALRWRRVQKKYGLTALPRDDQRLGETIQEIEAFVQTHAPGLPVIWSKNLNIKDPAVFPTGYRRATLAINAKFLILWGRDREAARAVLLHEIGHFRRGDGLVIGLGSPFETVIRYAFPAFLILFVVPFLIQSIDRLITSSSDFAGSGMTPPSILDYQLGLGTLQATQILAITGSYLLWFASFIIVPVAAIWAAEFGADRFAADSQGTAAGIKRILTTDSPKSRWRWLLNGLSHPPARLRLWMVDRRLSSALAFLALMLPVAYVLRPLLLQGWAGLQLSVAQFSPAEIRDQAINNSQWYVHTMTRAWLLMAALLVLWPFIVRGWERMMTGEPGVSARSNVPVYWASAAILVLLALYGISLGGALQSAAAVESQEAVVDVAADAPAVIGPAEPGMGVGRDAPAPLGTEVVSGNLGMAIVEVAQGEEAWAMLQEASMTATAPSAGDEYVLARVQVRNTGDEPLDLDPFQFGLTASGNVIHEVTAEIPPDPWLDMEVAPGGVADGWVVLRVGQDETNRQLVYLGDPFKGQPVEGWRFFALEDDAALPTGVPARS